MDKMRTEGMIKCPICKKLFLYNPMSIYKLTKKRKDKQVVIHYCSYTCWRKAGGDNAKRTYARHK